MNLTSSQPPIELTPGGLATLACLNEVAAPKPGNVHRGADFADTTFYDFQTSAVILGQTIDRCSQDPLGHTILECVRANQKWVGQNTNLGIILLLCPLAKSNAESQLDAQSTGQVFSALDANDCRMVYQAISLASPGGLGNTSNMDVQQSPPQDLLAAMRLAEDRDQVARQYSRNFETVFEFVVPKIRIALKSHPLHAAIAVAHIQLLAQFPDSLIARKCGLKTAKQSQLRAQKALDQLPSSESDFWKAAGDLDYWLRSDGNQRNPGTTADLIAAGLYVMFANGELHSTHTT